MTDNEYIRQLKERDLVGEFRPGGNLSMQQAGCSIQLNSYLRDLAVRGYDISKINHPSQDDDRRFKEPFLGAVGHAQMNTTPKAGDTQVLSSTCFEKAFVSRYNDLTLNAEPPRPALEVRDKSYPYTMAYMNKGSGYCDHRHPSFYSSEFRYFPFTKNFYDNTQVIMGNRYGSEVHKTQDELGPAEESNNKKSISRDAYGNYEIPWDQDPILSRRKIPEKASILGRVQEQPLFSQSLLNKAKKEEEERNKPYMENVKPRSDLLLTNRFLREPKLALLSLLNLWLDSIDKIYSPNGYSRPWETQTPVMIEKKHPTFRNDSTDFSKKEKQYSVLPSAKQIQKMWSQEVTSEEADKKEAFLKDISEANLTFLQVLVDNNLTINEFLLSTGIEFPLLKEDLLRLLYEKGFFGRTSWLVSNLMSVACCCCSDGINYTFGTCCIETVVYDCKRLEEAEIRKQEINKIGRLDQ